MIPFVPIESGKRVLDFDIETINAGFDDPEWTPQKATCVAWCWVDEGTPESRISTVEGLFTQPEKRVEMLLPLFGAIRHADVLTGHNIARFDLPILNAEAMRLGLPVLKNLTIEDTMWLPRAKGFKKGLDVMSELFGVPTPKKSMNWQQWQDAYAELGWDGIKQRAKGDVLMHMQLRQRFIERGWLQSRRWKG